MEPRSGVRQWLETMVEQSGLDLTLRKLLTMSVAVGLTLGLLVGLWHPNPLSVAAAAAVGACLPVLYVHLKRRARLEKLLSQLPDAFDLMARVVRAGQTLSQALQAVADEFAQPIVDRVLLLLRAAEPRPLARGGDARPGPPQRSARAEDLRDWPSWSSSRPAATSPRCSTSSRPSSVERYRIRGQIRSPDRRGPSRGAYLLRGRETLIFLQAKVRGHLGWVGLGTVLALGRPEMPAVRVGMLSGVSVLAKALVSGRIKTRSPPCSMQGTLPGPGPPQVGQLPWLSRCRAPPARVRNPREAQVSLLLPRPGVAPRAVPVSNGESISTASARHSASLVRHHFLLFRRPHAIHRM